MDTRSLPTVRDQSEPSDARHEVLADNTAQAVRNYLKKLFQEEVKFRSRWVWELLQNARDASSADGVRVWLALKPGSVVFRHDGLPFSYKNIAHLIYHGTTKYEPSLSGQDPIGQFGTGFLTTHLISRTVWVRGKITDGKRFDFLLDRRGDTADNLKRAMDHSWEKFMASRTQGLNRRTFRTEYEYPLTMDLFDSVDKDISDLVENAAYLLALNDRIRRLHIDRGDQPLVIEKKDHELLDDSAERLRIEERIGEGPARSRHVVVITDKNVSVAVEMSKSDHQWSVVTPIHMPRIYKAFPLVSTADFCLPFVINSEKFDPREDRDTLILRANRDGKNENMILMELACELAARMPVLAAEQGWTGVPALAKVNQIQPWDWADAGWLRLLLADRFVKPLRAAEVMETETDIIAPAGSLVPTLDSRELCEELWDLANGVKAYTERLPMCHEAWDWLETLTSWAAVLQEDVGDFDESLTLTKVCEWVAETENIENLQGHLREGTDAIAWLNQLYALISTAECIDLLESERIILSQSGAFKKITELSEDTGIDEELKEIAESLGLAVRSSLLSPRVELDELEDLQERTEEDVLSEVLHRFKEKAKAIEAEPAPERPPTPKFLMLRAAAPAGGSREPKHPSEPRKLFYDIAVRLFVWLVRHEETDKLDGFPVLSRASSAEHAALITLVDDDSKSDDRPLAPVACWPEPARAVADLLPRRQTLSDDYRVALGGDGEWETLAAEGYVRLDPLYTTRRRDVRFFPDEPLPVSDDKKVRHVTKDPVEVSALAYFEKEDTGLDAVRRSKTRAVELLLFLANYVLEAEPGALEAVTGDCECGAQHRYYRASWLVPMWDRKWVPLGDNKQAAATAESVAQLFRGQEERLSELTAGNGKKLLEALGISLADLALRAVAEEEDDRVSLIGSLASIVRAVGNDVEKVKLVAEEFRESPGLVDEIQARRDRRDMVRRNQSVGEQVEEFLHQILIGSGVKVTRTGVGSDFELTEDYLEDGQEVLLVLEGARRSLLVEVKATTGDAVRMTVAQASTAVKESDRFALCVVELETPEVSTEIVQEQCRFVMDIGTQIEPIWEEYDRFRETKGELRTTIGDVELDIAGSEVRFRIGAGAWEESLGIEDAIDLILNTCGPR